MDYVKVLAQLSSQYPNSKIIKLPENNPTEILVEIDPTQNHPDYSVAISIIDRSLPHYHKQVTELYEVLRGELSVFIDNVEHKLKEKDELEILPGTQHYAIGNETLVKCTARPGWTVCDHVLEEPKND